VILSAAVASSFSVIAAYELLVASSFTCRCRSARRVLKPSIIIMVTDRQPLSSQAVEISSTDQGREILPGRSAPLIHTETSCNYVTR
jgi:hypothetical protein